MDLITTDLTIERVSGGAFHLPGNGLNTDRIIPARFMRCVTFEGLGSHAFEDDRTQMKGRHPFDLPENKRRSILVVDENFGCGSSREHAVPALTQWGIRAIIGLSFAEIFRDNATGNGLVCVEVLPENHNNLIVTIEEHGVPDIEIDLVEKIIRMGFSDNDSDSSMNCTMPEAHRQMLIKGKWDQLTTALEAGKLIDQTELGLLPLRKYVAV